MTDHLTLATLLGLFVAVAVGAVVPVVPTGALVSASAAIAVDEHWWYVVAAVAVGAAGAWVGDVTTYAALRAVGVRLALRVGWLKPDAAESGPQRVRERIEQHEVRTFLVSRLIPGGRIPVLLAAALTGYPRARFAVAAASAALAWSATYALVGVAGGSVFDDPLVAVAVVVVAALALSGLIGLVRRRYGAEPAPA